MENIMILEEENQRGIDELARQTEERYAKGISQSTVSRIFIKLDRDNGYQIVLFNYMAK